MSIVYCAECGTKISDGAAACPHCGYAGGGETLLMVRDKKSIRHVMWSDVSLAEDFDFVIPVSPVQQDRFEELFGKAESLLMVAPAVYEEIKAMVPDKIVAAKIPGEVQKMLDSGVLKFVADGNGEILPTIFKDGKMFKQVRLETLDVTPDLGNAVINFQQQAALAEILHEVREVHESIRDIKQALRDDRLAKLDAAWYQLQQISLIGDSRVREAKLIAVSETAAEVKFMLEREFERDFKFFEAREGDRKWWELLGDSKGLEEGEQRSRELFQTIVSLTRAVQVESTAYCLMDEQEAARSCLMQFNGFIEQNRLNDRNVLVEVSQYNTDHQKPLIEEFTELNRKLGGLIEPPEDNVGKLPDGEGDVDDDEDLQD